MPLLEADLLAPDPTVSTPLSVVLCGSFRHDPESLSTTYAQLRKDFHVLSPLAVDFVDSSVEFVRLPAEADDSERDIESRHLEAMTHADFIWLHAPGGYVGTSAAMELGHANALGIPVFASTSPSDSVMASFIHPIPHPSLVTRAVLTQLERPGSGLSRLQAYYQAASLRRGWSAESPDDTFHLLSEELIELSEAIRKHAAGTSPLEDPDADVAGELADVQLYLVHLANALAMDLAASVTYKERVNAGRFEPKIDAA